MYFEKYSSNGWPSIGLFSIIIGAKENKTECLSYRYNIGHTFVDPEKLMEAANFAEENFKDDWLIGSERSGFENEDDAMAFKLTFV